jgi:hypothetical protein
LLLVPRVTAPGKCVVEPFGVLGEYFGILVYPLNVVCVPVSGIWHAELEVLEERHVLYSDDAVILFKLLVSAAHGVIDCKSHVLFFR